MQIKKNAAALVLLTTLAACSTSAGSGQPPASLSSPGPNIVSAPTAALGSTLGPQPTPEPTRALLPPESLTTVELHQRLDPFSGWMPDCSLPCYNGLLAGQSTTPDVYDFYSRLGIGLRDLIPGDYPGIEDGTGRLGAWLTKTTDVIQAEEMGLAPPLMSISVVDNLAELISVGWEYAPPYLTAPLVLQQMGQPDRVDLSLIFMQEPTSFMVHLLYARNNVGFMFAGQAVPGGSSLQVCLSSEQVAAATMNVYAPDLDPMEGIPFSQYLLPLDTSVGMSVADFAARISQAQCIDLPASAWPAWQNMEGNQPPGS